MSNTLITKLRSGEYVAASAIEITSIPHISTLPFDSGEAANTQYRNSVMTMMSEIYQIYYSVSMEKGALADIALELVQKSEAVVNQPYKARVRLYMIVRCIDKSVEEATKTAELIANTVSETLMHLSYEIAQCDESFQDELGRDMSGKQVKAVTKSENLYKCMSSAPMCVEFDRMSENLGNFAAFSDVLTRYPDCTVSFQLIPTAYTQAEASSVATMGQMMKNAIAQPFVPGGEMLMPGADKVCETYEYYTANASMPLFLYNIIVCAPSGAIAAVVGRLHAEISNGTDEQVRLSVVDINPFEVGIDSGIATLPWTINEHVVFNCRNNEMWQNSEISYDGFWRIPHIITNSELSGFFRLPIGGDGISAGFNINEAEKTKRTYSDRIINSSEISAGRLRSSAEGDEIGFNLKDLTKHMLITGSPGSGKTTFSVGLLDRLWKEHGIPFLVIEPAKNEYRALVESIPELQVFTPGKNFISPFVFNPFVPPKNVRLEAYKSTLKTAFAAALSMQSPLDKIFDETVNNCYSDFRWIDTYTTDDGAKIFNIRDFIKCFEETFDEIGYTGDAKNIGRAGSVRLKSLERLFDNYNTVPIEDLLSKPTVIELSAIENSEQKSLIIALLLLSILSYVNANYTGEGNLRNVILLEEAHVLLDATETAQGDANPNAIAKGLVKRMLAEIRAYGIGLIIADQSPRKVSEDVVGLTDIKLTFRLVEATDKQMISDSTGMSENMTARLSRLRPGEAMFFFNRLNEPEEIITENYRLNKKISITLSDESIASLSTYWRDKSDKLRPYPQCECVSCCSHTCDFARKTLAADVARRIFRKNFKVGTSDFEAVRKTFASISALVKAELNHEEFTPELLLCVKVHLWRRIRYETNIPIKDSMIEKSLNK